MKYRKQTSYITVVACLFCIASASPIRARSGDTLSVVNWNIEWFADGKAHNAAVQTAGVRTMMMAMNADIYALCEVVNIDSLASVVASLPGDYGYEVSSFGSFAASPASGSYAGDQKLSFVYRKSMVRRIATRALLSTSSTAYNSFSSGRYPYLVNAEVIGKDSIWRAVSFIIIHAKAFADAASCSRRVEGCRELKDSLDRFMPYSRFLILGDYNDDLDVSNCSSATESNYAFMVNDSLHYKALTLPISQAGAFSTDGYSSLIDHVIASDEMAVYYVPGSAEVLRPLAKSIDANYDNDISDHFPVRTRYVMDGDVPLSTSSAYKNEGAIAYPNPARDLLFIRNAGGRWQWSLLTNMEGQQVRSGSLTTNACIDVSRLPAGIYLLRLRDGAGNTAIERISIR